MKVKVHLNLEVEIEVNDPLLEHIAPLPKGSVVTVNNWKVIE